MAPNQHIENIRQILNMPTREEARWQSITQSDRKMLCRIAKLPEYNAGKNWGELNDIERKSLKDAAARAAEWANKLELN